MNEEKDEFDQIEREIQERANTYQKNTLKTKMTKQAEFQQALNLLELALDKLDELIKNVDIKKSKQKPIMWKMVPVEPTNEMLKAMDKCSNEGYDERLYAGHAASVYMAAVDAAPTPPQRTWVGLTDEEIKALASWWPSYDQMPALMVLAKEIQENLKERNNG